MVGVASLVGVSAVPRPSILASGEKQCHLERQTSQTNDECFLEPECGQECSMVEAYKCDMVMEMNCRSIDEEVCDTVQVR